MVDRRNRVRWTVIALLLLAAGTVGALIAFDLVSGVDGRTPLLPDAAAHGWRRARGWRLPALAAVGLLLALYGWRVLLAQLRRGGGRYGIGDLDLTTPLDTPGGEPSGKTGRTVVKGAALSHALEADLQRLSGVDRALVGLFGSPQSPDLRAQVDVVGAANLGHVRRQVERALERLASTSGAPPRSATVTFRVVQGENRRVT